MPSSLAGDNTQRLCALCQTFDVRDQLLLADADGTLKYETPWIKFSLKNIACSPQNFFKHRASLSALASSASSCSLCSLIWRSFDRPHNLSSEDLEAGVNAQQIYLACSPLGIAGHSLPQLVAFQHDTNGVVRTLAWMEIFAAHDEVPSDCSHLLARSIPDRADSVRGIGFVHESLRQCLLNHSECRDRKPAAPRLPSRVVDVTTRDESGDYSRPTLVDGQGCHEHFLALSYCWGGERALVLLDTASEQRLRKGLALEDFPPTLRDAILMTQRLGYRYIWIDALCIRQDDAEDWSCEAGKMQDVYKSAVLTLAAASAKKPSEGIFRDRAQSHREVCRIPWNGGEAAPHSVYLRNAAEFADTRLHQLAISRRAWTLQETLLAPRTLWFCEKQNTFECAAGQIDEAGRRLPISESYRSKRYVRQMSTDRQRLLFQMLRFLGVPPVIPGEGLMRILAPRSWLTRGLVTTSWFTQGMLSVTQDNTYLTYYDLWRDIVREYTRRTMSNSRDVFPALSGIANEFAEASGDKYLAGLWEGNILEGLCWNYLPPTSRMHEKVTEEERTAAQSLPSWTWACVGRPILFCGTRQPGARQGDYFISAHAKFLDSNLRRVGPSNFEALRQGRLVLRTPFLQVKDPRQPASRHFRAPELQKQANNLAGLDWLFQCLHVDHVGQQFGYIKMFTVRNVGRDLTKENWPEVMLPQVGLLLLVESDGKDHFRRVGLVKIDLNPSSVHPKATPEVESLQREWKAAPWKTRRITLV